MSTPLEYITRWNPAYSALPLINDWIAEAETCIGDIEPEETRSKAVALYTCHLLALNSRELSGDSGVVGAISSESEGDLSRSYKLTGDMSELDTYLSQTSYGLRLLHIVRANTFYVMNRFC